MTETMRERIARAIYNDRKRDGSPPWEIIDTQDAYFEVADVALSVLVDPTEAMIDAGVVASEHQSVSRIYRAMITAARSERPAAQETK